MAQDELNAKWQQLEEEESLREVGDDFAEPFEKWQEFLDSTGCVNKLGFQYNWGEYGILPLVSDLIEIINSGEQVQIFDDPSYEGMDHSGYLVYAK